MKKREDGFEVDTLKNPEIAPEFEIETDNKLKILLEEWNANEKLRKEVRNDMKTTWTEFVKLKI